jgi:hypothetical protein
MKHIGPFGVGRLMRASICGLLAATVIPGATAAGRIVGGVMTSPPVPSVNVAVPAVRTVSASGHVASPVGVTSTKSQRGKATPSKRAPKRPARSATASRALQSVIVDTTKGVFFTAFSPCTGEDMVGVANLHDVIVLNDNGTMHMTETIQGIKAVGVITNLTYTGSEELLVTNQTFPQPNAVFGADETIKLIRSGDVAGPLGSPDDFYMTFHVHTTANANGEVSSNFVKPIECR